MQGTKGVDRAELALLRVQWNSLLLLPATRCSTKCFSEIKFEILKFGGWVGVGLLVLNILVSLKGGTGLVLNLNYGQVLIC